MAGYADTGNSGGLFRFSIDTECLGDKLRAATKNTRVINFQVDGDELDAVLWGLQNFQKGTKVTILHNRDCPCPVEFCHVDPRLVKEGV